MSLRGRLISLARRMENAWQHVPLVGPAPALAAGWYITEFHLPGSLQHTPRIIVEPHDGKQRERLLIGSHAGRNRMLIWLPAGHLKAHSEAIEFSTLARVPGWEGRARVVLICGRYLLDFFNPWVLLKMIAMQFKSPFELSTQLLQFYQPPAETVGYLHALERWFRYPRLARLLAWWHRRIRIAVLIETPAQVRALDELLIPPDMIMTAEDYQAAAHGDSKPFDYLVPLKSTEVLRDTSMLLLKRAIARHGKAPALIYCDHDYDFDQEAGDRVMEPVFKPNPSLAYLHCFNYLGPTAMFSADALGQASAADIFDDEFQYRLAIKLMADVAAVLHVPETLLRSHRQTLHNTPAPDSPGSAWSNILWQRVGDHNALQVDPGWQDCPSVDLVIPTRDGLAVLKPCVDSILAKTDYPDYHIIIVDNGSEQAETHEYLAEVGQDARVSVIEYPGEFNYSAINNFAVASGESDYVAMVNNDIEVIHADWLRQMMVWVTQPDVGIVGAKLLFGDGRVQHAGVTIGMGNAAGHIHRLEQGDAPGYQNRCIATQNMMAVTAACLITPRALFESLGGLNETAFKVAYNDIDYCLRVESSGQHVIWTPEARLYHHESVSRGDDMSERHIKRYFKELGALQKRWKTRGFVDKYYSKHLRISDEGVYPQMAVKGKDKLVYRQ